MISTHGQLLGDLKGCDQEQALSAVLPVIYDELRRLASGYLRNERPDHTLQTTALVHEAYMRLSDGKTAQWESRGHFFRVAAKIMRRILINHAIAQKAGCTIAETAETRVNRGQDPNS